LFHVARFVLVVIDSFFDDGDDDTAKILDERASEGREAGCPPPGGFGSWRASWTKLFSQADAVAARPSQLVLLSGSGAANGGGGGTGGPGPPPKS